MNWMSHEEDDDFNWTDEEATAERAEGEPSKPLKLTPALQGKALIKEVCRLIRIARGHWDEHHNAAARRSRSRAMRLYESLTAQQREQVPQVLRVWLRYRSEKYYGTGKK